MAPTTQQQENDQDSQSTVPRDISHGPSKSLRPVPESASDNDASEKPVREKLKKTSIASISQHAMNNQEAEPKADSDPNETASSYNVDMATGEDTNSKDVGLIRGRPVRKRSFDDLEAPEGEKDSMDAVGQRQEVPNGHARKRSRDVRAGEPLKEDGRLRAIEVPVQEEAEHSTADEMSDKSSDDNSEKAVDAATEPLSRVEIEAGTHSRDTHGPPQQTLSIITENGTPEADEEAVDHEMRDSTASPRKKRSRDQFESEAEREQKIPATEEARAHRRSDEIDRSEDSSLGDQGMLPPEGISHTQKKSVPAEGDSSAADLVTETDGPNNKTFEITSTLSATAASNMSQPSSDSMTDSKEISADRQPEASATAFASSGFAALAQSSTSPFGALDAKSTNIDTLSLFPSSSAFSPKKSDPTEVASTKAQPTAGTGFGSFASSSSSGFGAGQPSPFGTTGATNTGVFGGSVFGGGFGGGFGAGNKLSNFASPTGDARVGTSNGSIKPIGSPSREDEDDEHSESDGEGTGENTRDEGGDEAHARFQHQDGKDGPFIISNMKLTCHSRNWRRRRRNCSLFARYSVHIQK